MSLFLVDAKAKSINLSTGGESLGLNHVQPDRQDSILLPKYGVFEMRELNSKEIQNVSGGIVEHIPNENGPYSRTIVRPAGDDGDHFTASISNAELLNSGAASWGDYFGAYMQNVAGDGGLLNGLGEALGDTLADRIADEVLGEEEDEIQIEIDLDIQVSTPLGLEHLGEGTFRDENNNFWIDENGDGNFDYAITPNGAVAFDDDFIVSIIEN